MNCFFCRDDVPEASKDVKAVLCSKCTARACGAPEIKPDVPKLSYEEKMARKAEKVERKKAKLEKAKTATRGKGRGWHLKRLFMFDGKAYSFGKEIDLAAANKLKKQIAKEEAGSPFAPA